MQADSDHSGTITLEEFQDHMRNEDFVALFAHAGITITDAEYVITILAPSSEQGDGISVVSAMPSTAFYRDPRVQLGRLQYRTLGPLCNSGMQAAAGTTRKAPTWYPGARRAAGIYKQPRVQLGRLQSCTRGPRCNGATQAAAGTPRTAPKRSP